MKVTYDVSYVYGFGSGKPLQPTVTPRRHDGALAYTELEAPHHRPVHQGEGEESQTAGGGGDAGEFVEGLPGLWGTAEDSHLVQVPGAVYDGGGRRLVGGGRQLKKGFEELDSDEEDPGSGGGRPEDILFF